MSIEENKDIGAQSQVANRPWEPRVGDVVRARGQSATLTVTRMWRATVAESEPEVEVFGAHCGVVLLPLDAVELVARALCPPARPIDANTTALIQAGERREQAERCGKCGLAVKVSGDQRTCERCSVSWRVRKPAAPQSAWVPENERDHAAEATDLREQVRELQAKLTAAENTIDSLRRDMVARDAEIGNLRIANELQKPAERSAACDAFVNYLRKLMADAALNDPLRGHRHVQEILRTLRGCMEMGPYRVEFGVKEVLP